MPEKKSIPMMAAVAFMIAAVTGAWALSSEVHNYRLTNITSRLKNHENSIIANMRAIDKLVVVQIERGSDIIEIKQDVKTLLNK